MSDPADIHPLWLGTTPLVLASSSRIRFDLLTAAGIPVEVCPATLDERVHAAPLVKASAKAEKIARCLASGKALMVSEKMTGRWVLGADQTLACEGVMLHKPVDRAAAHAQLRFLSGKAHRLHSAVALGRDGRVQKSFVQSATMTMRDLSDAMIARYLDAAGTDIFASVGGYQLERAGVHLFRRIGGDHSTILGLPLLRTLESFRQLELVAQ
jgi:septum formation protein